MSIDEIRQIPLIDRETLTLNKKTHNFNLPNKVQFYYWEKGYEPEIYLKADLISKDCYVDTVSDTIIKNEEDYAKALKEVKEELIDATIRERFNLICEEYIEVLKAIGKDLSNDYFEIDKYEAIKILQDTNIVEDKFKEDLTFYKEIFDKDNITRD